MSRQIAQPLGHYELATDEALALGTALMEIFELGSGTVKIPVMKEPL